jgi:hypothetical protein
MGPHAILSGFVIDGDGASYTGRGVVVEDAAPTVTLDWWRRFDGMVIRDMESYCVEFVGGKSGYLSEILGGSMTVRGGAVAAVKFPGAAQETNGNRRMIGVMTFDTPIADLAGSNCTLIMGCEGWAPIWTANTAKARVIGNRIPVGVGIVLSGEQGIFAENTIADTALELAAGLFNTVVADNMFPGSHVLTDNTVDSAYVDADLPRQFYTPTVSSGFAIGNGTLEGSWRRRGDRCMVHIKVVIGSTTTVGSGAWSFGLPKKALRNAVGQAYVEDASPVAVYPGVSMVQAGANTFRAVIAGFTAAYLGSATPIAWATGDKIDLEIEFTVK